MTLADYFEENNKCALAFSGGVDSAYLLYAAIKNGADVTAYYVKSQFQPQFEYDDACKLAKELGAKMSVINVDVLADEDVKANPANRCYFCKRQIFGTILETAKADGYELIIDGTNFSDDVADRPGMRVLQDMKVRSPLRECELTKDEIRKLSKEAGLFTWDKPAYACLATRIKTKEIITEATLEKVERAEGILVKFGFSDMRARVSGDTVKIQVPKSQFPLFFEHYNEINKEMKELFSSVLFDTDGR